jgi:hypothetical protein
MSGNKKPHFAIKVHNIDITNQKIILKKHQSSKMIWHETRTLHIDKTMRQYNYGAI